MKIGVPKEIKVHEYRVGLTPSSVREVVARPLGSRADAGGHGHRATDAELRTAAGATIVGTAAEVVRQRREVIKVKEPQAVERRMLRGRPGAVHLPAPAPDPDQARDLVDSGAICIAYETVTSAAGGLPLLAPMSEVAGRMSVQAGAHCLERAAGGMGILLGGVAGVTPARIVILGAGVVGRNAAQMAVRHAARRWWDRTSHRRGCPSRRDASAAAASSTSIPTGARTSSE